MVAVEELIEVETSGEKIEYKGFEIQLVRENSHGWKYFCVNCPKPFVGHTGSRERAIEGAKVAIDLAKAKQEN